MAVGLKAPSSLLAIKGIRLAATNAGIYGNPRNDLVLMEFGQHSQVSCVFTQNLFCAAPVIVAKNNINHKPCYCLINAGNANAGTGKQGLRDVKDCCLELSRLVSCDNNQILPFSTGVIGEPLPADKIISSIPTLLSELDENNWSDAARAIMTTDTIPKAISKKIIIGGKDVTITGMAKGSGMIQPNMATMLAFVTTDVKIDKKLLDQLLVDLVGNSFNRITVDGDTSTNDACLLVASAESQCEIKSLDDNDGLSFYKALEDVFYFLAQSIVRDGEGATKFVTVEVHEGYSEADCKKVAYCIAHSPLVKTALFASDPNWGRILAAVGRSGAKIDINLLEIFLNDVCIVQNGGLAENYSESDGLKVMRGDEINISVNLHQGDYSTWVWTSDLSYDYVKINAEYRT